jgi:hypothetical protein
MRRTETALELSQTVQVLPWEPSSEGIEQWSTYARSLQRALCDSTTSYLRGSRAWRDEPAVLMYSGVALLRRPFNPERIVRAGPEAVC